MGTIVSKLRSPEDSMVSNISSTGLIKIWVMLNAKVIVVSLEKVVGATKVDFMNEVVSELIMKGS